MPNRNPVTEAGLADFRLEGRMMRYSIFMPRLYNLCRSLGFRGEHMLPSRAFCSDESQGYPVILIAKHFGTFPFNHGRVGGIVATDRHGPYAEHGDDLVLLQASHVGYDPHDGSFGTYRRQRTEAGACGANCGKIGQVLTWYQEEYRYACTNIRVERSGGDHYVAIDNALLNDDRREGLFLHLEQFLAATTDAGMKPVRTLSTARVFRANPALAATLPAGAGTGLQPIGNGLHADMFYFRRPIADDVEGDAQIERNLQPVMAGIVTAHHPMLAAAQANTQIEFDRAYRSLVHSPFYRGKNLLFISGLNIDITPEPGQPFPLTKFIPWAAYVQPRGATPYVLEQEALWEVLSAQGTENPDETDLEQAIGAMAHATEVRVKTD